MILRTSGRAQEEINNFKLFDGEREEIDLFKRLNFAIANQTTKFGYWNPLSLLLSTSAASLSATSAASSATTTTSTSTESSATTGTGWGSSISHFVLIVDETK